MRTQAIQPSLSLRFIKGSLNLLLVPASLLTFFVYWSAIRNPLQQYADFSFNEIGFALASVFASLYLCRLAILWQMRSTTMPKTARKASRRAKAARKLPYALKPSDWVIEVSALIWLAASFLFVAYLMFERIIPLGFNSFN